MPRYKADLHSILKYGRLSQRHFLIVACQIIDVLKHLHEKHYIHSDIKAENIMVGLSKSSPNSSNDIIQSKLTRDFGKRLNDLNLNNVRKTRSLRSVRKVAYITDENSRSSNSVESVVTPDDDSDRDEDFDLTPRKRKLQKSLRKTKSSKICRNLLGKTEKKKSLEEIIDEQVYVIDYGLATKYVNVLGDSIVHKPFCCDERRAHDGTLEFTSRDAHFGAHSRRSDLECLG